MDNNSIWQLSLIPEVVEQFISYLISALTHFQLTLCHYEIICHLETFHTHNDIYVSHLPFNGDCAATAMDLPNAIQNDIIRHDLRLGELCDQTKEKNQFSIFNFHFQSIFDFSCEKGK